LSVIGGGFIGLEIAATARAWALEVTVLEATDRLMSRVVSPAVSAYFLAATGSGHRCAAPHDGVAHPTWAGVELAGGEALEAELVLVAAGVVANDELAEAAGLYVHDGIRVDDRLATEDPAIFAQSATAHPSPSAMTASRHGWSRCRTRSTRPSALPRG
jgi:3-phenylpropionate/trans-cinnamate dioxygenase ferredoxin reductase component